jgi:hypothetical protein
MKKFLLLTLLVPALWVLLVLPALSQEDMEVVKEEGFQKRQRPPAVFKHDHHNEAAELEECNECHHLYENGKKLEDESSEDQLCSDCQKERPDHVRCMPCQVMEKSRDLLCILTYPSRKRGKPCQKRSLLLMTI